MHTGENLSEGTSFLMGIKRLTLSIKFNLISGHAIYVDGSMAQNGDRGRIYSPIYTMDPLKHTCFAFYYHMYGHSEGKNLVRSECIE